MTKLDLTPEMLYKALTDLAQQIGDQGTQFGKQIEALRRDMSGRLDGVHSEISDLRVKLAEAGVLAVRMETVEKEVARVEKRASGDVQTAIQYITQIREELGTYEIEHAQTHHSLEAAWASSHAALLVTLTKHTEILSQHGGRWSNVRSIVIPVVASLVSSGVGALLILQAR